MNALTIKTNNKPAVMKKISKINIPNSYNLQNLLNYDKAI